MSNFWGALSSFNMNGKYKITIYLIAKYVSQCGIKNRLIALHLLMACSKHIDIIRKLIEVSHSGQSVEINFELSKSEVGDYQFVLLFETGDGHDEMERRFKLFGSIDKGGVITPVSFG
ncbi:DUF5625 family protein [Photorhabdus sp. P32]|uniref:DUF5625 family protein n=1 Tax=Photorhabdus sp. P32 TaxID=3117549 RepID=UPI00311AD568